MSSIMWNPPGVAQDPEAVALRAFGFVTADPTERDRFLRHSGFSAADIAKLPVRAEFLAAILSFLLADEAALRRFSRATDLSPELAYEARRVMGHRSPPLERAS